jgi:hypothetical protein
MMDSKNTLIEARGRLPHWKSTPLGKRLAAKKAKKAKRKK